jgi:hypothetical protein
MLMRSLLWVNQWLFPRQTRKAGTARNATTSLITKIAVDVIVIETVNGVNHTDRKAITTPCIATPFACDQYRESNP